MRAYISKLVDGRTTCGTEHNSVSREYKSMKQLIRFGVLPVIKTDQDALVEVFMNWDNRYGKPDITIHLRKTGDTSHHYLIVNQDSYRSSKLRPE